MRLGMTQRTGVAAIITDDYTSLLRVERLRSARNLTPWLRRRHGLGVTIADRLRSIRPRNVEVHILRELVQLARYGLPDDEIAVTIHATADRYVVHAELGGAIAARVVPARPAELRVLLSRLKLRYGRLRITIIDRTCGLLSQIRSFGLDCGLVLEAERMTDLVRGREREVRDILVVTNLNGPALPQLMENLDFWSRGPGGCRFRHIYGQLTARRAESALVRRHWDMVIYRGHGQVIDGRISWQAEAPWPLPQGVAGVYLHLSCLDAPQLLDLAQLPAGRVMTPLGVIEDFQDAHFVRELITRLQKSGSFMKSARALQRTYKDFTVICNS
ncbi:MAG: hypothetical protein OHK0011_09560 [Turneriella sp.]